MYGRFTIYFLVVGRSFRGDFAWFPKQCLHLKISYFCHKPGAVNIASGRSWSGLGWAGNDNDSE